MNWSIFGRNSDNNWRQIGSYTQRNLFEILLNQTEIRLYLPFSDGFETQTDFCLVPNGSENCNNNPSLA